MKPSIYSEKSAQKNLRPKDKKKINHMSMH